MLKGKSVLVTGASSGLGLHFARLAASQSATRIAVAARRIDRLEHLKRELTEKAGSNTKVTCLPLDVSSPALIRSAFDTIQHEWQAPADVVINNAGVAVSSSFLQVSEEEYDGILDVNLKGAFFVCQEAAKRMVAAKTQGGSIINISSILGERPGKDVSAYSVSKAGVIQMTKAAAMELVRLLRLTEPHPTDET